MPPLPDPSRRKAGRSDQQSLLAVIPTIARGQALATLARRAAYLNCDVLILASDDVISMRKRTEQGCLLEVRSFGERELRQTRERFRSSRSILPRSRGSWDLPDKRNHAILHARNSGYSVLLLLDDDIKSFTHLDVRSGYDRTLIAPIFGFLTGYFPDDSVTGHIAAFLGASTDRFVSGNCLFVRLGEQVGHFAGIYNEDWLFVLSSDIETIGTCPLKTVAQVPHMKWTSVNEAMWQEPGEFIAASIVDAVLTDHTLVFDKAFWVFAKSKRRSLLHDMRNKIRGMKDLVKVVDGSIAALDELTTDHIQRFMDDFAADSLSLRRKQ